MNQHTLNVMPNKMVAKGGIVFSEGELPHEGLYYICYGKVELQRKEKEGEMRTLATLGEGEIFGEMGVINSAPRNASAIALEDCGFYTISIDQFQHKTDQLDPLMRGVFRIFVLTIRDFLEQKKRWSEVAMQPEEQAEASAPEVPKGSLVEGVEQKMKY